MNTLELDWCSCVFLLCFGGGVLEHFYFSQMVVDLMEVIVCLDPNINRQGSLNLPMLGGNQTWCKRMVIWMDFPFNRVHSLGWCHLFMTPVKLDLKFKMRRTKNGSRKQRIASLLVRPSLQLGASEWPKLGGFGMTFFGGDFLWPPFGLSKRSLGRSWFRYVRKNQMYHKRWPNFMYTSYGCKGLLSLFTPKNLRIHNWDDFNTVTKKTKLNQAPSGMTFPDSFWWTIPVDDQLMKIYIPIELRYGCVPYQVV